MNLPTFEQAVNNVKQTKLQISVQLMAALIRDSGSVDKDAVLRVVSNAEEMIEQCMFEPLSDEIADGIQKDLDKMQADQVAGDVLQMPLQN